MQQHLSTTASTDSAIHIQEKTGPCCHDLSMFIPLLAFGFLKIWLAGFFQDHTVVDQILFQDGACRLVLPSSCKPEGPTYMYPYTDAAGRLFELLSRRALRVPSWRSASQALALLGWLRCQCLLTATEQVQDSLGKLTFLDLRLNGSILRSEALASLLEGVQALQGCMFCNRSEAFCCDQLCDQI